MKNVDEEAKKFVQEHDGNFLRRVNFHILIQDALSTFNDKEVIVNCGFEPFNSITEFVNWIDESWSGEMTFHQTDLDIMIQIVCDHYYDEFEQMNKFVKKINNEERTWPRLI